MAQVCVSLSSVQRTQASTKAYCKTITPQGDQAFGHRHRPRIRT
jgi:hypothetical protein